jgi:zinc transporter ZupT
MHAAVVVVALFFPVDVSEQLVECMLAAVAGIMTFLVVHEMMPLAIEHAGRKRASASVFVGMASMSASLHLLDSVMTR